MSANVTGRQYDFSGKVRNSARVYPGLVPTELRLFDMNWLVLNRSRNV